MARMCHLVLRKDEAVDLRRSRMFSSSRYGERVLRARNSVRLTRAYTSDPAKTVATETSPKNVAVAPSNQAMNRVWTATLAVDETLCVKGDVTRISSTDATWSRTPTAPTTHISSQKRAVYTACELSSVWNSPLKGK